MPFGRLSTHFKHKDKITTPLPTKAASSKSSGEPSPSGLTILADGVNPVLDIVAVHGLNGHREKTWTVDGVNWLRDLLPLNIENARILSWGYDANTHSGTQISFQYLYDHAKTLVADLCLERRLTKTRTRPIIFVAHSLGGIVVKSALIHSDAARQGALEEHRSIKLSTYGILFMGTPHQGGNGVRLGELMLKVASIFVAADDKILKHLERDSEWLQQQLGQYGPISNDFVTKFAYEIYPTTIALGRSIMIVPSASAIVPGAADAEPIAIPANHLNMVKFASCEDQGYKKISGHLQLLAEEAPEVIKQRWMEQDRIRKAQVNLDEDFSLPFTLVGAPEIENFVGRKNELADINEAFCNDRSKRKIVLLHGLGGIGKTQLAVEYVKEYRNTFSTVFWLNGKDEDTLKKSFAGMAQRLHNAYPASVSLRTAAEGENADQVMRVIKQWLSMKGNTRWIMVFDNIDNPKLPDNKDPQAYDIRPYFPEAHQGSILITTRSSGLKIGKLIPVKKLLDIQESIAILNSTSGRAISDQDPSAKELIQKLDGLPLALATAGAYLSQVSISLQDYLHHYNTSWLKLQETTPNLLSYDNRALYTTWNISLEHIQTQNASAANLLRLWAYFDNQDLWYQLLAAGSDDGPEWFSKLVNDELNFIQAIRVLRDHALIECLENPDGYGMHTCVHAWVVHVLNAEKNMSMARLALICVGLSVPWKDVHEYWVIQRRLLPHAGQCSPNIYDSINLESHDNVNALRAIHDLGLLYANQGNSKKAEEMYLRALTGFEKIDGPDHTNTLSTVCNLGNLYVEQGKMKEGEEMYLRALTGYEKIWASDHTETLDTVNNLGILYAKQDKMKEAEEMLLRALTGYEKIWGPDHEETLDAVNNLGILYVKQGKMKEAEEMYLRALTGYEKIWGFDHTDTLDTVYNLGILYSKGQDKMKEAEEMYLRALKGREKTLGPDHTSTFDTVNNLGLLYVEQDKMKEAEEMYLRALTGYEKAWGPDHTSTLGTVHNLGNLYLKRQDKMNEAEEMYLRALTGFEKAWGPDHKKPLDTRYNLALMYEKRSLYKDATQHLNLVIEGYTKIYGSEHPKTVDAVDFLEEVTNMVRESQEQENQPHRDDKANLKMKVQSRMVEFRARMRNFGSKGKERELDT